MSPAKKRGSDQIVLIHPRGGVRNPRTNEIGAVTAEVPPSLQNYPVITLDQDTLAEQSRELADELCERGDTWGDGAQSVRNAVIFLTALREAWNHVPAEADVVIFARPDVSIERSPYVRYHSAMVWGFSRFGIPAIRIPNWGGWRSKKGINDRFAIASRVAAERYFRRIEQLPEILPEGESFYTGTFLRYALTGLFLQKVIRAPMVRIRMGGIREIRDLGRLEPRDYRAQWDKFVRRTLRWLARLSGRR